MKPRTRKVDRLVRNYDSRLFATERNDGCVIVWRKGDRWGILTDDSNPELARFIPQPIIALTDDWKLTGRPVEWGMTPLYFKLSEMDSHRDDSTYDQIVKEREEIERTKERHQYNEIKAFAADHHSLFKKTYDQL